MTELNDRSVKTLHRYKMFKCLTPTKFCNNQTLPFDLMKNLPPNYFIYHYDFCKIIITCVRECQVFTSR